MAESRFNGIDISEKTGWISLQEFLTIIHRSVSDTQGKLASLQSEEGQIVLKDLKVDLPVEIHVDPDTNQTKIRFPSEARHIDNAFHDEHLSRISFTLGYIPIRRKRE
jgi:hypothetical protein